MTWVSEVFPTALPPFSKSTPLPPAPPIPMAPFATEGNTAHPLAVLKNLSIEGSTFLNMSTAASAFLMAAESSSEGAARTGKERTASSGRAATRRRMVMDSSLVPSRHGGQVQLGSRRLRAAGWRLGRFDLHQQGSHSGTTRFSSVHIHHSPYVHDRE